MPSVLNISRALVRLSTLTADLALLVQVAGALVLAAEDALHRRDVHDVGARIWCKVSSGIAVAQRRRACGNVGSGDAAHLS